MVAVSVIVPARDAAGTLPRTLSALREQDFEGGYEVIVVDDGSRDSTAAIAQGAEGVTALRQRAAGPGPARNAGVAAASGDVLAFTDADCTPARDWLREGVGALERADLVQGVVRPDRTAVRAPFDRTISVTREHGLYETANMFVRRDLFERLGGFEDWLAVRIGKPLAEDVWFGWRARQSGARVVFCERAVVEHAVFARGAGGYIAEQLRLAYFPALVAKVPELRDEFLWRRWFLSRRTAAFAAAALGLAAAASVAATASVAIAAVPLAAGLPYAWLAGREALAWGRRSPWVAVVCLAADAVGAVALAWGSLRRRALVL